MLFRKLPLEHETALFLLAATLDFLFTAWVLPREGFHEANPLARTILALAGMRGLLVFKFGLVAGICLLAQVIAVHRPGAARAVLNLATLITVLVLFYSVALLVSSATGGG